MTTTMNLMIGASDNTSRALTVFVKRDRLIPNELRSYCLQILLEMYPGWIDSSTLRITFESIDLLIIASPSIASHSQAALSELPELGLSIEFVMA